jgi:predicted ferric reductase
MDPIDLSNFAGLGALGLLTLNILIGLLLATRYNPVRRWPHRKIDTVQIHNWAGWLALLLAFVHPALLLLPSRVRFRLVDLLFPLDGPKQPWVNAAGALALYLLVFIVVTSYFRFQIGRRWWKRMHFTAYALFPAFAVHSVLTEPGLRDLPIDYLDGEKVFVELCVLVVIGAMSLRVAWQRRQPPPRQHRARVTVRRAA